MLETARLRKDVLAKKQRVRQVGAALIVLTLLLVIAAAILIPLSVLDGKKWFNININERGRLNLMNQPCVKIRFEIKVQNEAYSYSILAA